MIDVSNESMCDMTFLSLFSEGVLSLSGQVPGTQDIACAGHAQ
jgi:hypothetical protein